MGGTSTPPANLCVAFGTLCRDLGDLFEDKYDGMRMLQHCQHWAVASDKANEEKAKKVIAVLRSANKLVTVVNPNYHDYKGKGHTSLRDAATKPETPRHKASPMEVVSVLMEPGNALEVIKQAVELGIRNVYVERNGCSPEMQVCMPHPCLVYWPYWPYLMLGARCSCLQNCIAPAPPSRCRRSRKPTACRWPRAA